MKVRKFELQNLFDIKKVYGKPFKTYPKGHIPYITGTNENNGLVGFVEAPSEAISAANCISVDPITGQCHYQPFDFVGRGFSGASINLLYNSKLNAKSALYVCAAIETLSTEIASYTRLFNSIRLKEAKIELPITENGTPDWKYMEQYVIKIGKERIEKLKVENAKKFKIYLDITGLDNYELTKEDEKILTLYEKSSYYKDEYKDEFDGIWLKKFKLQDLFEIEIAKSFDKKNLLFDDNGTCDFIGRSSINNGIQGTLYPLDIKPNDSDTFSLIQIGENVAIWRKRPWYASQNIFKLTPKIDKIKKVPLFIKIAIDKSMSVYGDNIYASYPTKKSLFETNILLPATPDGSPDFDYMEKCIRAIEKLTIKNKIEKGNKKLEAMKTIVTND